VVSVRLERAADVAAVRAIHVAAFPTDAEARLVDALREAGQALVSLVAEREGAILGHAIYSPVPLDPPGPPGVVELLPGALPGGPALVRYRAEFTHLDA